MDRGKYGQWVADGKPTLADRAHRRVQELLAGPAEGALSDGLMTELQAIMTDHVRHYGMEKLPAGCR